MLDAMKIRQEFPIFTKRPELVYFDNACTTQKPKSVVEAMNEYYHEYAGCAGRSQHRLAKETDEEIEFAREKVAKFVNAAPNELIWTRNATEALNFVANSFDFSKHKEVLLSNFEHHSALLPFQRLANEKKISIDYVLADKEGNFNLGDWQSKISKDTALVVVHHTNNTLGTTAPVSEIAKLAHDAGAKILVDGAQGVPHKKVDVKKSGIDFLAFSGHKMLGPTGIGCLVARDAVQQFLRPFNIGGGTVESVDLGNHELLPDMHRYEAGIQHYSGIVGLAAAVDFLQKVGMENIEAYEHQQAKMLLEQLQKIPNITIYGPKHAENKSALVSFNIGNLKAHEIAIMLDESAGICVRSGHFCAQPTMEFLGNKAGAVRASLYIYNTKEEIDKFGNALKEVVSVLS